MPLNAANTKTAYRCIWGGLSKSLILNKRNDDQQEGTVTAYRLFNCKRGNISKTGQPIQGDMSVHSHTSWIIPVEELRRVGITYLNAGDTLVEDRDEQNQPIDSSQWRYWVPLADSTIDEKTFNNYIVLNVRLLNPNRSQ